LGVGGGRRGAFYATICPKVNAAPEDKLFRKKGSDWENTLKKFRE